MQLVKNVDIAWKEVEGQKAQLDSWWKDAWVQNTNKDKQRGTRQAS